LIYDIGPRIKTFSVEHLARVRLDNAALLAYRVYYTDLPLFDAVYTRCGGDLRAAVGQIIAAVRESAGDPFSGLRLWTKSNASCARAR
jgi:hypothetical protein